jgi:hypothetical protein
MSATFVKNSSSTSDGASTNDSALGGTGFSAALGLAAIEVAGMKLSGQGYAGEKSGNQA